ncbi:MAG: tetratricopeptide repeat protein [Woeseiaceae bacterium]
MSLFAELQRRNVIRVAIAYAVASWVLLQIVDVVSPILELPDWAPKLIFLILAIGLVPALIFSWAFEMTPEGLKKESEVDRSRSISGQTGKKLDYAIIGTLTIAVLLLLVDRQYGVTTDDAPVTAMADTDAVIDDEEKSIAVLPFVNMSSDEEQEYFSDGITEEILNSLAGVKELKVAGRTSSFAFKGQNDDLRRIGDALGVNHILEGSVRKAGGKVRITAQLIRVDNGFHLWSETYDRELTDVFAIQDEIANEILKQLQSRLLAEDAVVAEAKRTDPEVYALYLRAKQRIYSRFGSEIEIAVRELDRAIQLDPEYAPAYAQRGIATMLLSDQQYGSIPNDESNRRGKRFADQALRLDPELAEGWAALGLYYGRDGTETDAGIDALVKALEINPNSIDASNWLQIALRSAGDMRGGLEIIEEITERDPLYRPAFSNAMMMFNNFGQQDKAIALLERMEAFDPDNPDLILARAINYMYSGRNGEGLRQMEMRREVGPMSGVANMFLHFGLAGTWQWERAAEEGSQYFHPEALYELGRKEEAFDLAYEFASSGNPGGLFSLLVRDGRDQDLANFLEERWPSVAALSKEHPGDDVGYDLMADVALAYRRLGNQARSDEAMLTLDRWLQNLSEQGINNFVFSASLAELYALNGDIDAAIEELRVAVDGGLSNYGAIEAVWPQMATLASDPRLPELEEAMLANLNRERAVVGLPPLDADNEIGVP